MDFEMDPFDRPNKIEDPGLAIFEEERPVIEEDVEMEDNHTVEHFHEQRFY